ncbi:MAG TPA: hypothetical protein VEW46_04700 [Pyrinomonadaceae bacterium]|nr:hypothetical protein [Pyrinomonadaceae bacterium]
MPSIARFVAQYLFLAFALNIFFSANTTSATNLIATYDFDTTSTEADPEFWTVLLRFKIANESAAPALFDGDPTVWDGNLKVFVADETGFLKEYFGPGWGTRDLLRPELLKLLPGQSFETEATVLWNQKINSRYAHWIRQSLLKPQESIEQIERN